MKVSLVNSTILILLVIFCADIWAAPGRSNSLMSPSKRMKNWEFNLAARYLNSQSQSFTSGASIDIDSTMGWGFGLGYNFSENLGLNFNAAWSSAKYNAVIINAEDNSKQNVSANLDGSSFDLRLIYNFMNKQFTPFVTGGLGGVYLDSNIPNGELSGSCWWDPWYGYICSSYERTHAETRFTYGVSAGLRFDVNRIFFLRASVGNQWVDLSGSNSDMSTVYYLLDLGIMLR